MHNSNAVPSRPHHCKHKAKMRGIALVIFGHWCKRKTTKKVRTIRAVKSKQYLPAFCEGSLRHTSTVALQPPDYILSTMVQDVADCKPNDSADFDKKVVFFPAHIPIELLRYILEIATTLDRKVTARNIVLSSKLLRSWYAVQFSTKHPTEYSL